VYQEALGFRAQLATLLLQAFNLKAGLHHYLGQLRRGLTEDFLGEEVRLKRLFYALRSALAARWLRERQTLPPMEFAQLCEVLPANYLEVVNELLAQKAFSNEKTLVAQPAAFCGRARGRAGGAVGASGTTKRRWPNASAGYAATR